MQQVQGSSQLPNTFSLGVQPCEGTISAEHTLAVDAGRMECGIPSPHVIRARGHHNKAAT